MFPYFYSQKLIIFTRFQVEKNFDNNILTKQMIGPLKVLSNYQRLGNLKS